MSGVLRVMMGVMLAGWLADELARPDGDVEAGIEAYEAEELDVALEHFEAAIARHGDRPELSYNRGLVRLAQGEPSEARRAFERATEAEDPEVRASAFYELGNVALDTEDYPSAVEAYIECLKARPEHSNAKWNLELAQKLQQEQEQEDEEDEEDEEDDDGTGGDETGDDETGGDETGGSDTGGSDTGGDETGGSDTGGGDETGGSDTGGGEESGGDSGGETGGEESGGEEGDSGGETGDDQPPDDGGETGNDQPPPPQPEPLDQMDIQRALEELDEQDHFPLDRPPVGRRPPTEDW